MRHIFSQYLFSDINAPFSTGCTHYLVKVEPYDSKKPRVTSIEQLIIKSRADSLQITGMYRIINSSIKNSEGKNACKYI